MAVVRGQIYQFNLNPLVFFSIQRVYSPNQIIIMNVDTNAKTYFTEARLLSTCTLVPSVPENRVHNIYHQPAGMGGVKLSHIEGHPFLSATVGTRQTITARGKAPTYLRGRLIHGSMLTHASVTCPLLLGGHLAAQGAVVQAQAN